MNFLEFYSSDHTTAKQTMKEIIVHHNDSQVTYCENLRERNYGFFENQPYPTLLNIIKVK